MFPRNPDLFPRQYRFATCRRISYCPILVRRKSRFLSEVGSARNRNGFSKLLAIACGRRMNESNPYEGFKRYGELGQASIPRKKLAIR